MKNIWFILFLWSSIFCEGLFEVKDIEEYATKKLDKKLVGESFQLYGKLISIGKKNRVTSSIYTKDKFVIREYYAVNHIYTKQQPLWGEITGEYVNIDEHRVEIKITSYKKLLSFSKIKQKCSDIFSKEFPKYDLNTFKKTMRFQIALKHLKNKDLNKSPYEKLLQVTHVDSDKMIAAVLCGKSCLHRSIVRGDFLSYHAIYDFKNNKIIKIYVSNTGYFLE